MEFRRILLDGNVVEVVRDGDTLIAADGRRVEAATATHLPPGLAHQDPVLPPQPRVARARVRHRAPARTHVVPQAGLGAQRARRRRRSTGQLPLPQLRRRDRDRHRRTARNIKLADAADYIAGYTIANDFGLHDFRDTDAGSMLRVKGADTLCPSVPGS